MKDDFRRVTDKGFHRALNFIDDFKEEHVRYVMSRIHDQFMWLDRPHKITKEAIHTVSGLWSTGEFPILRSISKDEVIQLTKSKWDCYAMMINYIDDPTVKFASMVYWHSTLL